MRMHIIAAALTIAGCGTAVGQTVSSGQERRPGQTREAYEAQEDARWGRGPAWSATRPRLPYATGSDQPPVSGYRPPGSQGRGTR